MKRRIYTEAQKIAMREYHRAYRAKNAERLREQRGAYYEAHKEELKERFKRYRAENNKTLRLYDKWRRLAEPEKKRALDKAYREKNRTAINAKRAPYFAARKAEKREYDIAYRDANKGRLKNRYLNYYSANKASFCARVVKRNAQKLKASPKWANDFFIEEAYHLAALRSKMLGYPWHVDHVVPLQSPVVCGLHVEHNLRVIPGKENLAKGNRHWPDMA